MNSQEHREKINATRASHQLSPHLQTSFDLIERADGDHSASIIEVGAGASTLVDDLIVAGYRNLTVLDISLSAIEVAKNRLGDAAKSIHWLRADVTKGNLAIHSYTTGATTAPFFTS